MLREQLEAEVEAGARASDIVELDQARVGRLSRMDAMQAQAMSQASDRRRDQMLRRIEAALVRIEDNEFGICMLCEEAINPRRLDFDPTATLCIDCANKSEQKT